MSFYNLIHGMNPQADLLLAVVGLRRTDIERFRDVSVSDDGSEISVYTRTGGGNRPCYPNTTMRERPEWRDSDDDSFDSTYATDTFEVPEQWRDDVAKLDDMLANGLRPEFGQHLAATLRREPTEDDKYDAAYRNERQTIGSVKHTLANGHTYVPHDDRAMEAMLKLAEDNDGALRAGPILPIRLTIVQDADRLGAYCRAAIDVVYGWKIDMPYWRRCQQQFGDKYPKAMAKIGERVAEYVARGDVFDDVPATATA